MADQPESSCVYSDLARQVIEMGMKFTFVKLVQKQQE